MLWDRITDDECYAIGEAEEAAQRTLLEWTSGDARHAEELLAGWIAQEFSSHFERDQSEECVAAFAHMVNRLLELRGTRYRVVEIAPEGE
jgi:hypothetical protein